MIHESIDIELVDKALKLTWIRRFLTGNSKWKLLTIEMYPGMGKIIHYGNFFILNLSKTINNLFWINVLTYLYVFHEKVDLTNLEELHASSFLYSENFKIGGSVISNNIFRSGGDSNRSRNRGKKSIISGSLS